MNDDLTALRGAWPTPEPPSPTARAEARAALLERAAASRHDQAPAPARRRFRLPRMGVRLVAVGALATAIAVGATVAQNLGGTDEHGRPRPVVPGIPAGPVANAAEALERAAVAAERRPFQAPRPDQWIYTEFRNRRGGGPGGVSTGGPIRTTTDRMWKRADGTKSATERNGKIEIVGMLPTTPPSDYPTLAELPADPDALLARIYREMGGLGETEQGRYETAYSMLSAILRGNALPPRQEAAIFRAIKKIPGVTLTGKADAAGRPAIALGRLTEGWLHQELLLDPNTYAYLGERSIAVKTHTLRGDDGTVTVKKGTLQLESVRLATGIVDKPGQRP